KLEFSPALPLDGCCSPCCGPSLLPEESSGLPLPGAASSFEGESSGSVDGSPALPSSDGWSVFAPWGFLAFELSASGALIVSSAASVAGSRLLDWILSPGSGTETPSCFNNAVIRFSGGRFTFSAEAGGFQPSASITIVVNGGFRSSVRVIP